MEGALQELFYLINECEWEYPDAHSHVVIDFDVDADDLRDAYDQYCRSL